MRLDPAWFDPTLIDPEVVSFNADIEEQLRVAPPAYTIEPQVLRDLREEGKSIFGPLELSDRAKTMEIPGPAGPINLRIFRPAHIEGVYFHIHGGGWMLGGAHHLDPQLEQLSDECSLAVVSVDYRLAPENPFPAGPDDCEAAALWLVDKALAEFGSDRLCIGGESGGAHLSAVTLLRMRDRHDYKGFVAANLVYGMYDLNYTPSVRMFGERPLILTTRIIEWFVESAASDADRSDPDVSPIHADLTGLPPALFTIGTLDPLLDDSLFMAARWESDGNQAELSVYPGAIHAFDYFPTRQGRSARSSMQEFLSSQLA